MIATPKLMTVTDAAADRIRAIMDKSDEPIAGLRIGIENSGCAGVGYTMEYAAEAPAGDDVVEDKGVTLFIDPKAVMFLLGTKMDYKVEKMTSGFVFDNPNQKSACGCGESVELEAVSTTAMNSFMAGE